MAWNEPGPGKDPWSQGPRKGEGPPDLDEMLKRFKARFGGGRTPPGARAPLPFGLIGLVVALFGVLWLFSGFYVVDEQERAVTLRFGKYVGTTEPGLRWHIPWPVEQVEVVNFTGVREARDEATMLTRDENIVVVELKVQYRVSNVEDYVFSVNDPDLTLKQAIKSAVRAVVGRSSMDYVLTEGREEMGDRTKVILQELLDSYKVGLIVTEVNLQQAQPPEPVQAAFGDAIKAREDQQRSRNEALAYANDRLPKARGAAARQVEEASAYRDQVVAKAEGDAARFQQLLVEYRRSPRVTRERIYLDSMNAVLGSTSKVLIDVDKGSPMLYLPLEQLLKSAPAPSRDNASDYITAPGALPGSGSLPGGDPSRSRDRGR
ncbi:FtsH protease activity modulator HflK [Solimonas sp. K1W22B-7]|uniref:FtsH protease activity modulator HflK n=1 Tax=Solimonas sp. K1W22B-7 TaxID=2303331 RepID=UPI000E32F6D5|nr:FtsH protease activity modulator HflK [Solimonas sp. K1W22B-7]AXQ29682.1 FtsH protease activity modulator HflK [Solimonas sp. K1W22B-7]